LISCSVCISIFIVIGKKTSINEDPEIELKENKKNFKAKKIDKQPNVQPIIPQTHQPQKNLNQYQVQPLISTLNQVQHLIPSLNQQFKIQQGLPILNQDQIMLTTRFNSKS
jgi:hypothetical protein